MLVALTLRKYWIAMDSFRNEKENDLKNRIYILKTLVHAAY